MFNYGNSFYPVLFDNSNDVFFPAKIQQTGYPIIYHGTLK